jgi:hypothetical protein
MRVGAGNCVTLCDLGVFVDQAAEPVPAHNAHSGHFRRPMCTSGGRILQQRPVWPVRVLVIDILAQDQPQVPFADDQHLVQALAAGAGDPAFGNRVVGWGARVSRLDGVRLGNAVSPV